MVMPALSARLRVLPTPLGFPRCGTQSVYVFQEQVLDKATTVWNTVPPELKVAAVPEGL